jgi:hypothetical protein
MRPVPARLIRACILEAGIELPGPSKRDLEKYPRILAAARAVFATTWLYDVKLTKFARELHMSPDTVGRIFLDMESILAEILREHLHAVIAAIDAVPAESQDLYTARRAAYFAATREPNGDYVPDHKLFKRQCHLLPPDLKGPIEALYATIGPRLSRTAAASPSPCSTCPPAPPSRTRNPPSPSCPLARSRCPPPPLRSTGPPSPIQSPPKSPRKPANPRCIETKVDR